MRRTLFPGPPHGRANTIWRRLLAEANPPALNPPIAEALDAFVARREREIESEA